MTRISGITTAFIVASMAVACTKEKASNSTKGGEVKPATQDQLTQTQPTNTTTTGQTIVTTHTAPQTVQTQLPTGQAGNQVPGQQQVDPKVDQKVAPIPAQVQLNQSSISPVQQTGATAPLAFKVRFPRHILGKPASNVYLEPSVDTYEQLPVLQEALVSANREVVLPAYTRVWGQLKLKEEASKAPTSRTVFLAQGFMLPNEAHTIYSIAVNNAAGYIPSVDKRVLDVKDTLLHVGAGAAAGAAVSVVLSLTTGDHRIQAWETLAGTTVGAILSAIFWRDNDPIVQIEKDTVANVCFGVVCQ